jgi:hypothetical protein
MADKSPLAQSVDEPVSAEDVKAEIDFTKTSPIPDTFTRVDLCCCAFRCTNFDFPGCIGCKGNCQICCFEQEGFCCKSVSHDKVCCVVFHDTLECVMCATACKTYRQCFCCELICGCPLDSAYVHTTAAYSNIPTSGKSIVTSEVVPCSACLCSISSLYLRFPGCISCYEKTTCCCFETESVCCRIMTCSSNRKKETLCMVFEKSNFYIVWPTTFIKSISQCMLFDSRCAIPCDSEVPCICMMLPFCTCCVNCKPRCECCATVGALSAPPPADAAEVPK